MFLTYSTLYMCLISTYSLKTTEATACVRMPVFNLTTFYKNNSYVKYNMLIRFQKQKLILFITIITSFSTTIQYIIYNLRNPNDLACDS